MLTESRRLRGAVETSEARSGLVQQFLQQYQLSHDEVYALKVSNAPAGSAMSCAWMQHCDICSVSMHDKRGASCLRGSPCERCAAASFNKRFRSLDAKNGSKQSGWSRQVGHPACELPSEEGEAVASLGRWSGCGCTQYTHRARAETGPKRQSVVQTQEEEVGERFYAALERVRLIHGNCRALLRGAHQRAGLELMDAMALHQEAAYERLCRYTPRCCDERRLSVTRAIIVQHLDVCWLFVRMNTGLAWVRLWPACLPIRWRNMFTPMCASAGGCRTSAADSAKRTPQRWTRCCSAQRPRCGRAPCCSATAPRRLSIVTTASLYIHAP